MPSKPLILYGAPHSLYTGRARSYLIKANIDYAEQAPNTPHFVETVVPKAGGRLGLPTVEFPSGDVIRDGAAIIDHFEAQSGHSFSPATPKQHVFSLLFDVIGAEGLLRPAMHYRWNFPENNLSFLMFHFEMLMPEGKDRKAMAEKAAERMRGAGVNFGVSPEAFDMIEALYADVVDRLDAHFAAHPYLLGTKPCIGDFGMIAPLYGHLGRDPEPLTIMQKRAPHLFRWVERMHRPEPDLCEFGHSNSEYIAGDTIPETLIALLETLSEDFVPETLAAANQINQWLNEQSDLPAGTEVARGTGFAEFSVRGIALSALAQPYRFYLLKRFQDAYANLDGENLRSVDSILDACGMAPLLDAKLSRDIGRANNLEVWL